MPRWPDMVEFNAWMDENHPNVVLTPYQCQWIADCLNIRKVVAWRQGKASGHSFAARLLAQALQEVPRGGK